MADEKQLLEQAKQLIIKKQYSDARQILLPIQHNATAQKWLAKLDEVAPVPQVEAVPIPESVRTELPPAPSPLPEPVPAITPLPSAAASLPDIDTPVIRPIAPPPPAADVEAIEQLRPRKPPRQMGLEAEAPEDRAKFEQVKEILSQAQMILRQMPGNRRANRWRTRLDNIDKPYPGERFFDAGPEATPQQRVIHFIHEGKSSQTRSDLQEFVNSNTFRYVVGGTAVFMAIMMLLGFFLFSWVDLGVNDLTPAQIWFGTNDTIPTLRAADIYGGENGDFGDIRFIDRLLILIPFLACGLLAVGALYLLKKIPTKQALIILIALSLVLLLMGFFWRTLSAGSWRGEIKEDVSYDDMTDTQQERYDEQLDEQIDILKSAYSTGEHELYAFLAFAVTFGGLVLLIADERGMLEPDYA